MTSAPRVEHEEPHCRCTIINSLGPNICTHKFSIPTSILFLEELFERIDKRSKHVPFSAQVILNSRFPFSLLCNGIVRRNLVLVSLGTLKVHFIFTVNRVYWIRPICVRFWVNNFKAKDMTGKKHLHKMAFFSLLVCIWDTTARCVTFLSILSCLLVSIKKYNITAIVVP